MTAIHSSFRPADDDNAASVPAELAGESRPGHASAGQLDPAWRTALPERLEALARSTSRPYCPSPR